MRAAVSLALTLALQCEEPALRLPANDCGVNGNSQGGAIREVLKLRVSVVKFMDPLEITT